MRSGDRVLDVGCGTGQTTRDAARAAAPGAVLGVDLSAEMLKRARELTVAAGLENVTYQHGDAQVHRFTTAGYDLAISRFGTMFFSDPLAAFTNIAGALRPHARLVMLVWQRHERNEWATAIDTALGTSGRLWRTSATLDAFSLADQSTTSAILDSAGFHHITFTQIREPVFYGRDSVAALDTVLTFHSVREALTSMSSIDAAAARQRLQDSLQAHDTGTGVVFDSRAWLVTAHRTDQIRPATTEWNTP